MSEKFNPTRGYPIHVRRRAVEHREAGWSYRRIGELLHKEYGLKPNYTTLVAWCDPDQAEKKKERDDRRCQAQATGRVGGHRSEATKLARLRALNEAGLTSNAVAIVIGVDYGDHLTGNQVLRALETGRYPTKVRPRSLSRPLGRAVAA